VDSEGRAGKCGRGTAIRPARLAALAFKLARSVNPSTLEMGRVRGPHVAGCLADRKARALTP